MTLAEQLEELKQKQREIEKSIREVEEQIEVEHLKKLVDGISAYDLLIVLKKRSHTIDMESVVAYDKVRNTLAEMQRKAVEE